VRSVGSYCADISLCTVNKTSNLSMPKKQSNPDPANYQSTETHDIYQLLYIQSSTSWWWAV